MIRFMSLASGSTGNCYYLEHNQQGILIDAGITYYDIKEGLAQQGLSLERDVHAILLTHNHADHARTVGTLANHYELPVYATQPVQVELDRMRGVERIKHQERFAIEAEQPFELIGLTITPFTVPHDSADNVGYHISSEEGFSFTLATDIGHLTPTIEHYASIAHHLVLESNYDTEMLRIGKYPPFLKKRISGPLGHLSNAESVDFLCRIWRPTMRNVFLCHLSKENNHPELVRKTFDIRLFSEGIRVGKDVYITPLQRNHCSPMYLLET